MNDKEKNLEVHLVEIAKAIGKIENFIKDKTREDFLENELIQDAVLRNIQVIGEAITDLPAEYKDKHQQIPWQLIKNMRNKIVHGYREIDYKIVWVTITTELSTLKDQINLLLKEL